MKPPTIGVCVPGVPTAPATSPRPLLTGHAEVLRQTKPPERSQLWVPEEAQSSMKTPDDLNSAAVHLPSRAPRPTHRLLRGYAFDPSLATQLDTALVSEVLYKVPWEDLPNGPQGEYLQVVDYDPASGCFYAPVDLDDPRVLAQNGLAPSEGNPQFHQQMVYAVAMTTIDRFERALGRKAMWAEHWDRGRTQFVQHLRIYPHALRQPNAYYSRDKGSLLFGYFPAASERTASQFPGGMIFTCLSHDIVAHETTHALLDGFHEHFLEPTNADVLAFHEAFADIVALFQHFTFSEVLQHQIARTRGNLAGSENLLGQLATQFGHARGMHGALRDAIGRYNKKTKQWEPHIPDPTELERTTEVHGRGAILVAAVFDAFLSIYRHRTSDLLRLASGGTGVLPQGELHPDLVKRLAGEATKAAGHVLNMCIRALDYCPPVDLTFGEYLRALVSADKDLMPEDLHGYRVAFIEAFRRRGIYPGNVRTLSEESLRWERPDEEADFAAMGEIRAQLRPLIQDLRQHVDRLRYLKERREIWRELQRVQSDVHAVIRRHVTKAKALQRLTGLALGNYNPPPGVRVGDDGAPKFSVKGFREARRQREDGRVLNQAFITLLQVRKVILDDEEITMRCGSTVVLDLDDLEITCVIRKGLYDTERMRRTAVFTAAFGAATGLAQTYFGLSREPFAALHHQGA